VGSTEVKIAAIYLEGTSLNPTASTVSIANTVSYSLTTGSYTSGAAYTLKVVTATGGTFSFSVVCGKAG